MADVENPFELDAEWIYGIRAGESRVELLRRDLAAADAQVLYKDKCVQLRTMQIEDGRRKVLLPKYGDFLVGCNAPSFALTTRDVMLGKFAGFDMAPIPMPAYVNLFAVLPQDTDETIICRYRFVMGDCSRGFIVPDSEGRLLLCLHGSVAPVPDNLLVAINAQGPLRTTRDLFARPKT